LKYVVLFQFAATRKLAALFGHGPGLVDEFLLFHEQRVPGDAIFFALVGISLVAHDFFSCEPGWRRATDSACN
jgi:hypothetical protein